METHHNLNEKEDLKIGIFICKCGGNISDIVDVDELKKAKLGLKGRGMGKFKGGIIVNIAPTKVPRLIGKKGSMINMIKERTKCKIVVGQNGLVWVRGDKDMEQITKNIVHLIEAEAHTSGLTNRIRDKLYLLIEGEIPEGLDDVDFDYSNNDDSFEGGVVPESRSSENKSNENRPYNNRPNENRSSDNRSSEKPKGRFFNKRNNKSNSFKRNNTSSDDFLEKT